MLRFSVGGPVIAGDVAVVAPSQFGFVGVDWRRGAIAWSKPSGLHVAPPAVLADTTVALVGDCFAAPPIPDGERLLGCLRVVTPAGVEMTGAATPADSIAPPPLVVEHAGKRWEIELDDDGKILARARRGGPAVWSTERRYTAVLGAVWQRDATPMIRIAALAERAGTPHVRVLDLDATGSLRSASARAMPGIALLGRATSPVADAALAVRLDRSLRRDFIAGYAVSAAVMWVYPLPEQARPDPVGVAVAPDVVIVFHDGATVTVVPDCRSLLRRWSRKRHGFTSPTGPSWTERAAAPGPGQQGHWCWRRDPQLPDDEALHQDELPPNSAPCL